MGPGTVGPTIGLAGLTNPLGDSTRALELGAAALGDPEDVDGLAAFGFELTPPEGV